MNMKTISLRWAFCGVNLLFGVINIGILLGGTFLIGQSVGGWRAVIWSGGMFLALFLLENLVMLSVWLLPQFKQLTRAEALLTKEEGLPLPPAFWLQEFHDLAQWQRSNAEYWRELTQTSRELFAREGSQPGKTQPKTDTVHHFMGQLVELIRSLESRIEDMAKGNLAIDLPAESRETSLGKALLTLIGEIRQFIINIRKEVNNISTASAKVAAMSQQSSRNADLETEAVEQISASITQVAHNLKEIIQNMTRQTASLDGTFTAIDKMVTSVEEIDQDIAILSGTAEATSRSIAEIHTYMQAIEAQAHASAQISEAVSDEAQNGSQAVEAVIQGIHTIKNTVEDAAATIQRLGVESGRIDEILSVINDIAEQTNLLALNASIIAAQAGEHGRGFSVVAGEIKELAERTRSSTQEIGAIIRSVQAEVTQGMSAIQLCLHAVGEGVYLANQAEETLQKIVQGIQQSKEMVTTMAKATVTQTQNSLQVKQATEQVTQKSAGLQVIANNQAKENEQLAKAAQVLQEITQQIDRSALEQLQEADTIVKSLQKIQELVSRNSRMTRQIAQSSNELNALEGNLAENVGRFFIIEHQLPTRFDPHKVTIAFIRQGSHLFYDPIQKGVEDMAMQNQLQSIMLNAQGDPVMQTEHINWLIQQPWLKGIVMAPVDEQTGNRLAEHVVRQGIPVVAVDAYLDNAYVSVISDNQLGGQYAAEILHESLPANSVVMLCGFRNVSSVNQRLSGFFKQATTYGWKVVEIFASVFDIQQAKEQILEGLGLAENVEGIFLTNETIIFAYLELLREKKVSGRTLHAVGFDFPAQLAEPIADGRLAGTIAQDPYALGKVAIEQLVTMLKEHRRSGGLPKSKEVFVPVKKITKENLPDSQL
jgi:methyl-accepting chemotaxis protein/ABC-type sugar transport system substrate-binding protein